MALSVIHQLWIKKIKIKKKNALKLTENPGEPKVTEFDDLVFGDEDVFRLDVSVNALQGTEKLNRCTENSTTCPEACGDCVRNSKKETSVWGPCSICCV